MKNSASKLVSMLLALAMLFTLCACQSKDNGENKPTEPAKSSTTSAEKSEVKSEVKSETKPEDGGPAVLATTDLRIGTTDFYIQLPVDYEQGEMTDADKTDGQVGYWKSSQRPVDLDIYQFPKSEEDTDDLQTYVKAEAQEYNVTDVTEFTYNNVSGYFYNAEEEFEGATYSTITYAFASDTDFCEVVFWMDDAEDADQKATVAVMIENLVEDKANGIVKLGETGCTVQAGGYYQGENDGSEDLQAYMISRASTMDFDVYAWAAEDGETLAGYAAEEAEGKELTTATVNGIETVSYMDEEEDNGKTYTTKTVILLENGQFAELVFWLDGETAVAEADAVLNTLTK